MTFNPDVFGWPQWTMLVLLFLAVSINATRHGQDRSGKYNGIAAFVWFMMWMFILICGGFFA